MSTGIDKKGECSATGPRGSEWEKLLMVFEKCTSNRYPRVYV